MFLLHANTYEIIRSEFSREFLKTFFARLPPLASASAARCGPHPRTFLATPVVGLVVSAAAAAVVAKQHNSVGLPVKGR